MTLFDAGTGQPLKTTQLSAEITAKALPATVRNDSTALGQAQVLFGAMQWSAHTHELMLEVTTFQADLTGSGQASVLNTALVLIPDGGDLRVISAPGDSQSGATSSSITTSFAPLPVTRWDVSAGTASATTVPQALAYTWTANDSLAATLTLPSTPDTAPPAVQITPIGNPAGDTTFSTWQSGSIGFGSSCGDSNGGGVCCTNITYLTATFGGPTAWSPDGRYILTPPIGGTAIGAVGELAAPPVDTANIPGACSGAQTSVQYVRLPARDAGLTNSLRAFDLSRVGLVVAWSPDGQRIAVRADHSLSGSAHELSIFDCRTGKLLGSYSADQVQHGLPSDRGSTAQFGIGLPPIWSPDGTHLLILDNDLRVLSILGHDMIEH